MLANGRDGNRSGVRPLTSLVVSQKNWNVRFSMSRNSGVNSGGLGRSAGVGEGAAGSCAIGPGVVVRLGSFGWPARVCNRHQQYAIARNESNGRKKNFIRSQEGVSSSDIDTVSPRR